MSADRLQELENELRRVGANDRMRLFDLRRRIAREKKLLMEKGIVSQRSPLPPPAPTTTATTTIQASSKDLTRIIALAKSINEKMLEKEQQIRTLGETCGERPWSDIPAKASFVESRNNLVKRMNECKNSILQTDLSKCLDELPQLLILYELEHASVMGALRDRCKRIQPTFVSKKEIDNRQQVIANSNTALGSVARSAGSMLTSAANAAITVSSVSLKSIEVGLNVANTLLSYTSDVTTRPEQQLLEYEQSLRIEDVSEQTQPRPQPQITYNVLNLLTYGSNSELEPKETATAFALRSNGQPIDLAIEEAAEEDANENIDEPLDNAMAQLVDRLSLTDETTSDEQIGQRETETFVELSRSKRTRRAPNRLLF
jgi:hypothetical protein